MVERKIKSINKFEKIKMVKEEPMSVGERHSSKHEFESNQ